MKKLSGIRWPLLCAVLFCLGNAFKPALIDDTAYLLFIPPILENPAQPYGPPPDGFQLIWYGDGQGAFTLLIPMVLPYWLALGASLFGENLMLLKLWLFPFCLIFTLALSSLLRRFAPGYVKPLLAATVFSPAFLPSLNVMLDVPSIALGLAALALFCKAVDSEKTRWRLVIFSGIVAGLAAQTKYSGATATAAICLYAVLNRRWLAGFVTGALSLSVFAGWEAYLCHLYGRSHFLYHLEERSDSVGQELFLPLFSNLGGLTIGVTGFLLIGLRFWRGIVLAVVGLELAGFLLMAIVPDSVVLFDGDPENLIDDIRVSAAVCGICGAIFTGALLAALGYLVFRGSSRWRLQAIFTGALFTAIGCLVWRRSSRWRILRWNRATWFLAGWLAIELTAYFAMSPFACARRVLSIFVVCTLISGKLLSLTGRSRARHRLVNLLAALAIGAGILFAWTDYRDALIEKRAVDMCADWIREQPGGGRTIWFTGHWGFQYYANRKGLREFYPGESILEEGDWIVCPDEVLRPYGGQVIDLNPATAENRGYFELDDWWPLRTIQNFYLGYQPICHHEGPRVRVSLYRVKKTFRAKSAPPG